MIKYKNKTKLYISFNLINDNVYTVAFDIVAQRHS